MNTTTKFIYPVVATLALACFAVSPTAHAVSPAPDGGYPNGNTAEGTNALFSLTTGAYNTANGLKALFSNTIGDNNTADGYEALFQNTDRNYSTVGLRIGQQNTAIGAQAIYSNKTGSNNTADGYQALFHNTDIVDPRTATLTSGQYNTATGSQALFSNMTGSNNTANGYQALFHNTDIVDPQTGTFTSGQYNTATGSQALYSNTTGQYNTATGQQALFSNTTGHENEADGVTALYHNTTGHDNVALGFRTLFENTGGNRNIALGSSAGYSNTTGVFNVAVGDSALFHNTGSGNIALGYQAGSNLTTGGANIDIGDPGVAGESLTIRIGNNASQSACFIGGVFGGANAAGMPVYVASDGHLGTNPSSARFKADIKDMGDASSVLLSLRPVTFHYKEERDPQHIPQFGLVAEEVEKADPALIVRDKEGKPYGVRYEAVNAMLLNEFLKEHGKVQQLEANAAEQQKHIDALTAQLKEQKAFIQKVNDKVEMNKPAPQTVRNE